MIKFDKSILWFVPCFLLLVLFSVNAPTISDSGLYHIQSVKWIEEYAVVPGLGNVHGRFAFNPSVFSLFAGFNFSGYLVSLFFHSIFG